MRRVALLVLALACLLPASASVAQSPPPACEPAKNGFLDQARVDDVEQLQGSRALYATHRLELRAFADIEVPDDPDGSQYNILTDSERIAQRPGVLGRLAFMEDTPGHIDLPVEWTVTRGLFGEPKEPYCTGSATVPVTVRKPTPTSLTAERFLIDRTGDSPRVHVTIAGRKSDDLRPLSVRIRRGARGRARTLFTLPLADVTSNTARHRFAKRFAGMTITSGPRNDLSFVRGLLAVDVSVPKLRDDRRLRRDFTLEVVREGRTLLRVRAVLGCRGAGAIQPVQICTTPRWRVTRPAR